MKKGFSRVLYGIALLGSALFIGCGVEVHSDESVCVVPAPQFVTVQNTTLQTVLVDGVFLRPGESTIVNVAPDVATCEDVSFAADLNDFVIELEPLNVTVVGGVIFIL